MAFRFRKSIRLAPGVRVNLSRSGASLSVGVRGASVTVGPRGTYANVGLPGTGLSHRSRIGGPSAAGASEVPPAFSSPTPERMQVSGLILSGLPDVVLTLDARGYVVGHDREGAPLSRGQVNSLWKQRPDLLSRWLAGRIEAINGNADWLANVHLGTPAPDALPAYERTPFRRAAPDEPTPPPPLDPPLLPATAPPGALTRLLPPLRRRWERRAREAEAAHHRALAEWSRRADAQDARYAADRARWESAYAEWDQARSEHERAEAELEALLTQGLAEDEVVMETELEAAFERLDWPRETLVSFELRGDGAEVWLDVDLPEVEDMPQRSAELAASGRKLNIRDRSERAVREAYARHVHGVALRLGGVAFAHLPASRRVVVSAYTQRADPATGVMRDVYLFSVCFARPAFAEIDFSALERVDPVAALDRFEPVREMSRTGIFRPITPPAPGEKSRKA